MLRRNLAVDGKVVIFKIVCFEATADTRIAVNATQYSSSLPPTEMSGSRPQPLLGEAIAVDISCRVHRQQNAKKAIIYFGSSAN